MIHLQGSLLCQHWLNNWIWELCCLGNIHLNEIRFMAPCSLCMCVCHIDPTASVEIWKESPEGLVKEGDTVELRCQGDGNPPAPIIFNQEQVRIASFFSFIWTRFFWMGGCKPLRRSGHSRRLAQTMCFICSGWIWQKDNSGSQMFQMADQSKAKVREVTMISKQLPAVLNSAKIFFIIFQSMSKKPVYKCAKLLFFLFYWNN